jgi:hypothetical protein
MRSAPALLKRDRAEPAFGVTVRLQLTTAAEAGRRDGWLRTAWNPSVMHV